MPFAYDTFRFILVEQLRRYAVEIPTDFFTSRPRNMAPATFLKAVALLPLQKGLALREKLYTLSLRRQPNSRQDINLLYENQRINLCSVLDVPSQIIRGRLQTKEQARKEDCVLDGELTCELIKTLNKKRLYSGMKTLKTRLCLGRVAMRVFGAKKVENV